MMSNGTGVRSPDPDRVAQVGPDGLFPVFGGLSGPRACGDVTEDAAGVGFGTDLCGIA